ncbi:AbgT family transporter, partial [Klebsiella pneumoniae]|uniref:AbgT family transporter n=1 Tax=Klebsiella pneumoniae TaxID=573 RepID=UPI002109B1D0
TGVTAWALGPLTTMPFFFRSSNSCQAWPPENGILRDPVQHTVMPSPFIKGIVPLIIFFFFVVSLAYGIATGKIRRERQQETALATMKRFRWQAIV